METDVKTQQDHEKEEDSETLQHFLLWFLSHSKKEQLQGHVELV